MIDCRIALLVALFPLGCNKAPAGDAQLEQWGDTFRSAGLARCWSSPIGRGSTRTARRSDGFHRLFSRSDPLTETRGDPRLTAWLEALDPLARDRLGRRLAALAEAGGAVVRVPSG